MIAPVHSSHTPQPAREVGFLDIWTAQVSGNPVYRALIGQYRGCFVRTSDNRGDNGLSEGRLWRPVKPEKP